MAAPRTGAERFFPSLGEHDWGDVDPNPLSDGSVLFAKAELARRAGMPPEAVRRLFSVEGPNPTAATLVALADALDLELVARPAERAAS